MKGMIGPWFPCSECSEPMGMTKKGHLNYRSFMRCRKCGQDNADTAMYQLIIASGKLD